MLPRSHKSRMMNTLAAVPCRRCFGSFFPGVSPGGIQDRTGTAACGIGTSESKSQSCWPAPRGCRTCPGRTGRRDVWGWRLSWVSKLAYQMWQLVPQIIKQLVRFCKLFVDAFFDKEKRDCFRKRPFSASRFCSDKPGCFSWSWCGSKKHWRDWRQVRSCAKDAKGAVGFFFALWILAGDIYKLRTVSIQSKMELEVNTELALFDASHGSMIHSAFHLMAVTFRVYEEKFMECFQKVSEAIGPVYRRLTAQQGADGGSAYLDLEDGEGLRCGIFTWHHVILGWNKTGGMVMKKVSLMLFWPEPSDFRLQDAENPFNGGVKVHYLYFFVHPIGLLETTKLVLFCPNPGF